MLKTATEIISESFQLYKKHWREFTPFILILFIPHFILSSLGTIFLYLEIWLPASASFTNIIILVIAVAVAVLSIWASIGFTKTIYAAITNQPINWKVDFSNSSKLILPTILTTILTVLIILGGTLLLIIPGIIFTVWYSFFYYALILDNKKGLDALSASKTLVVGRWWSILWRTTAPAFIFGMLGSIISLGLYGIASMPLPIFLLATLTSLLTSLINTMIAPLYTTAGLILYKNAKENPVGSELPLTPPKI
jgi:hypothetical protein